MAITVRLFGLIAGVFLFLQCGSVLSAEINKDGRGVLAKGYDLVSFFHGIPVKGNGEFSTQFKGVKIYFSSQENADKFLQAPQRFMPQFGGYCAYGVRHGKKLDVNPLAYAIEDGQLYFLLNAATKELWDEERERNIKIANKVWPTIRANTLSQLAD